MSRFCTLSSSSRGNSVFISGGSTAVLVDCGVSYRRLRVMLHELGADVAGLAGILITHEHSDHISGLTTLLKRVNVPVYGSEETLRYLCANDIVPVSGTVIPISGAMAIGELEVLPFDTPHDAAHSIGMRILLPDGRRVGFATDLGHVTPQVQTHLTGCDLVYIESNYDPGMLFCSHYPYQIKQRINGSHGHLSNADCTAEISRLISCGSTRFILGHLSEQNNLPQLAAQTTRAALSEKGMREGSDYILSVARAREPIPVVVF